MVQMINDLLDVHKIETGRMDLKLEMGDFVQAVHSVIERNGFATQAKGVDLTVQVPDAIPRFLFDPARIEQVMGNLVDNAIKFSFSGARIEVAVRFDDTEILFSVRDYGPGIPAKEQGRLFKPFSTTSVRPTGNEKSTGLGLAIAESIVSRHGGRIWVETEEGKGSTFTFSLPLQQDPP